MKDYYIIDSQGKQTGPFPGKALKLRGVTPNTFVWCEGLGSNWVKAGDIDELKPLFAPKSTPTNPPANTVPNNSNASPITKAYAHGQSNGQWGQQPYGQTRQQPQQAPQQPYGQQPYGQQPYGQQTPPENYLVWSIVVTLCCCVIGGIVAIVYASKVNSKWAMGDYQGAIKDANNAKTWCIISAVIGLITNTISFFTYTLPILQSI